MSTAMISRQTEAGGEVRDEVAEFATAMEAKLRKNDHKTSWQKLPVEALRRLMMLEIEEFNVAREFFGSAEAMAELVDIANFAMMLRDRIRIAEYDKQKAAGAGYQSGELDKYRDMQNSYLNGDWTK